MKKSDKLFLAGIVLFIIGLFIEIRFENFIGIIVSIPLAAISMCAAQVYGAEGNWFK